MRLTAQDTGSYTRDEIAAVRARRRRQGIVISYAYTIAQVVVNLLYIPLLLAVIGQDEYGIYQTVGPIMAYIVSINSVLSAGVGRFYSMYKAEGDERMMASTLAIAKRLYWLLSLVAVVAVAVIIPIFRMLYIGSFSGEQLDECSLMFVVLAANTVVTFNNAVNIAAINACERFVFLKGTQLVTLVSQPLLVLLLGRYFPNALTITVVILVMNILSATLQRVFAQVRLHIASTYYGWDKRLVRGLLGFSVAVIMVTVADQLFWSSGKLVVAYYFGASAVAVYAVGAQVYSAYMYAGISVAGVFFQRVSELYHKDHDMSSISALFAKVGRVTFLVCSLILGGFIVLGRDFIALWAGEGFSDAFWIALAVMLPMTIDLIQNLGLTIMQVEDKYRFRGYVYISLAVANLVLSILFVSRFGIVCAGVLSGICMFVGNGLVMNWYYVKHVGLDIKCFWREIAGLAAPFACATAVSGIVYSLVPVGHGTVWLFLAGGVFYLVAYAVAVGKWGLNDYERGVIGGFLSKVPALRKFVKMRRASHGDQ